MRTLRDINGLNTNINCVILSPEIMTQYGFRENKENWYRFREIIKDISLCITIYKDETKRPRIDVLDENFGQPYDYQSILKESPECKPAVKVKLIVDTTLKILSDVGIVTGFVQGEYV